MRQELRPAIHVEKPLLAAVRWVGLESQGISRVGQTVLARVMESQICHQPASSVALPAFLSGRKLSPALALMPATSVPTSVPLVPFKLPPQCWSSEGVSLSKFMCVL